MRSPGPLSWLLVAGALLAVPSARPAFAQGQAQATLVASGLSQPLYVTAPSGDDRLFIVQRLGRIQIVLDNGTPTTFLDLTSRISTAGEGGLLGMAFPPDYASSGLFYVYYTDLADDGVVSRFSLTSPDVADPDSEEVVLFLDLPDGDADHNGGTIQFGPDGFLWFATGDGGDAFDPPENAQNWQRLLGKMLRIDPGPNFAPDSIPVAGQIYRIPADNPFVASAPRDEIWARGLRNPFRWSFDRTSGDVWIADVGESTFEEVNWSATHPGGRNYGWDVMEGSACVSFDPSPLPPCNNSSLTAPILEYDHSGGRCSVIGGYVYRADSSALSGLYFFGDFCTGQVWSLNPANRALVERTSELGAAAGVPFTLVGFGEDGFGRLLLVQRNAGTIYRIESATPPQNCGLGPELAPALAALAALAALRRARRRSPACYSRNAARS